MRPPGSRIGVWIDRAGDTGHGLSEEICPELFMLADDGLTYVHRGDLIPLGDHNTPRSLGALVMEMVVVAPDLEDKAIEAALDQPEGNIHLEYVSIKDDGSITGIWNVDTQTYDSVL